MKQQPHATIKKSVIVLSKEAFDQFGLTETTAAYLLWDDDRSLIGIEAAEEGNRDAFNVRETTSGFSIRAPRFFLDFKLAGMTIVEGTPLGEEDGIVTILVAVKSRAAGSVPKQRRRRRTRAEMDAARAAEQYNFT